MTTLTINLPESDSNIIDDIVLLVKNAGGNIAIYQNEDLTKEELKSELKDALGQVTDIIEGKVARKSLRDILNGEHS